jgi:hypothetical protein
MNELGIILGDPVELAAVRGLRRQARVRALNSIERLRPDLDVTKAGIFFRIKVKEHKAMRGSGGVL